MTHVMPVNHAVAQPSYDFTRFEKSQHIALVVIPTYNEALNIERLLHAVLEQDSRLDVLVVDDNSPDGTNKLVTQIAEQTSRVHLLSRPGKLGLGTAYLAGFKQALQQNYTYILQMDADFSHQPQYLPILLTIAENVADVALGSRNVPGGRVENWPMLRNLISKGGSLYTRLVLQLPVHDCTGGFKCFRASALRKLDLDGISANGYGFQVEMNYRCSKKGLNIVEFPIVFPERVAGKSKMSGHIVAEAALMVWRLRLGLNSPPANRPVELAPSKPSTN